MKCALISLLLALNISCTEPAPISDEAWQLKALRTHWSQSGISPGLVELWEFSLPVADEARFTKIFSVTDGGECLVADDFLVFFEAAENTVIELEESPYFFEGQTDVDNLNRLLAELMPGAEREQGALRNPHTGSLLVWSRGEDDQTMLMEDVTRELITPDSPAHMAVTRISELAITDLKSTKS